MSFVIKQQLWLAIWPFLISVLNIGGWQKNACKNNLYKEGEDTLAFKCPRDCFLESLGMHKELDQ